MAIVQGLIFLFFGLGLLVMDWQSLTKGWLPCGPNLLKGRLEFRRDAQPLAYWLMFAVYGAGGVWLTAFALRLLSGSAEPLPLQ
jgi:hypothetical protein